MRIFFAVILFAVSVLAALLGAISAADARPVVFAVAGVFALAGVLLITLRKKKRSGQGNYVPAVKQPLPVPLLVENPALKNGMFGLLETAHENTKARLAQMRKDGTPEKPVTLEKKKSTVRPAVYPDLLNPPPADATMGEKHSYLHQKIKMYYALRDTEPGALEKAIGACKDLIAIAPEVAREHQKEHDDYVASLRLSLEKAKSRGDSESAEFYGNDLKTAMGRSERITSNWQHLGYKQLCIIYEKQGNWQEVIRLAEEAKAGGWSEGSEGGWDRRIERARKNLAKQGLDGKG